jgi:hypothetical protein
MDTIQIFKKAASLTWRYRLLWLFGFLLALAVINIPFWLPFAGDDDGELMENRIIFQATTVYFPGEGVTIDLRPSGGPVVTIEGLEPGEFLDLVKDVRLSDIWALLITIGVVILISALLRILIRYTSQAALIRMVDEHERSQRMVNLRGGLRLAWSRVAWKLFLIDLTIAVVLLLVFGLLFALAISPFFLLGRESITESVASIIGVSLLGLGGLSLFAFLAFIAGAFLSIIRPVMHQACAVDGLGVGASLRQGFRLLRIRFSEVLITWLVWLAVRLAWAVALIPVAIILTPLLLPSMLAGIVVGAVLALLATGIASLFVSPIFAWLIGVVVGLPVFLLVTFAPINFLSGLVEAFKSSFWTLSYREFRPLVSAAVQPSEEPGLAKLETSLAQ